MKLKYDPSKSSVNILLDNSCDPNLISLTPAFETLTHHTFYPKNFKNFLDDDISESLSILLLNISSIKKNFETFKNFLSTVNYNFSIICFCETWLDETNHENSNYELPGYYSIYQIRNNCKGCGVSTYIKKSCA